MVKINIITGFLGAGKTTLLRKMLKSPIFNKEKIVIIENEFGEMGIDGDIIREDDVKVYEISHGCICCALKNDFLTTLIEIVTNIKPDRILIEPSGIFIIDDFKEILKSPKLIKKCELGSIITVVDSVIFLRSNLKYLMFFENQIGHASHIITSKVQNIKKNDIDKLVADLCTINSQANIITKPWDKLSHKDLQMLLSKNEALYFDSEKKQYNHLQDSPLMSIGIQTTKEFTKNEIEKIVDSIKNKEFGDIIRLKGFIKNKDLMWQINYIDGDYSLSKIDTISDGKINIIGNHLKKERLLEIFE